MAIGVLILLLGIAAVLMIAAVRGNFTAAMNALFGQKQQ